MTSGDRLGMGGGAPPSLSYALQGGQEGMAHRVGPSCHRAAAVGLESMVGGLRASSPCRRSDPESRFKHSIIPGDRFFLFLPPLGSCI